MSSSRVESLLSGAIALGLGDNNVGETAALGALASGIRTGIMDGNISGDRALLFSDSAGVIGFLCRGWRPPTKVALSREARRAVAKLREVIKVDLFWVRGHAGVPGNEEADIKAKEGAAASPQLIEGPPPRNGGSLGSCSRRTGLRPNTRICVEPKLILI